MKESQICDNRAVIAELASFIFLVVGLAQLSLALWPDEAVVKQLRTYLQSVAYTPALSDNVRTLTWMIMATSIAVVAYFFRLFCSLYAFDSMQKYCHDWLFFLPTWARQLEWLGRFLIVIMLMLTLQFGFGPVSRLLPIWLGGADLAIMSQSELSSIGELASALRYVVAVLWLLVVWSIVILAGWLFSRGEKTLVKVRDWLGRFMIGPVLSLLMILVLAEALAKPASIVSEPSKFAIVAGLVVVQLVYSLWGLFAGPRLASEIWSVVWRNLGPAWRATKCNAHARLQIP